MSEEQETKTCFVICPIGDAGTETRKRSDQVLKHIIKPAVKDCGYETPIRADAIAAPGNITSQVIQNVYDADLVLADLTKHNPNVFYELAIRHAVRKPVILIMERISDYETIPFDIAQDRVIYFDLKDLDSADECKENMIKQIRSVEENNGGNDSPISSALDIKLLRESGDTQKEYFGEILEMLADLRRLVPMAGTELRTSNTFRADPTFINRLIIDWEIFQSAIRDLFFWFVNRTEDHFDDYDQLLSSYRTVVKGMYKLQDTFIGQDFDIDDDIPF